jgi:ABC-2 type transport system ATP-binding protein
LPENAPLYPDLSIQRYLRMIADLREIPATQQREYISDAVYATNLVDHLNRPIGELSKGYRQRVGLAQAILHRPKLLILDEPTIGLDPTQIVDIRRLIQRLSRTSTILFSTHILSEVEALCNRAVIIIDGAIRADARLPELAESAGAVLVLQQPVPEVDALLAPLPGVTGVDAFAAPGGYPAWRVHASGESDLCPAIYHLARQKAWPVRELRSDARTLEDVFNSLVTTPQ